MKQRLGIAIALVNDPEVVFLDEPTTGLDPHARREVWDVLLDLKKKGKTVFLTTHYMEEAELLADTVAIISKGKIVAMGSPDELIERNANYLLLTLKSVDANARAIVQKMGFEPVPHENHKNIKVRVEHTDDVQKILNAMTERRGVAARLGRSQAQPRRGLPEAHRRGAPRRPRRRGCRNEPTRHRGKSRREHQELLPREVRDVLHDCVPDHPDPRVRHDFHEPGHVTFALHVQDLDQTTSSAQLVKMLERSGRFRITTVDPAVDATQYAKDNKLNLVLVIPKGYEQRAGAEDDVP